MDLATFQLRAGDVDTAAELYAALVALQAALGAAGVSQGLRDVDIPGPVPNQAFGQMAYLQPLQWRSYIPGQLPGGFPITSIFAPITGTLGYVLYSAYDAHRLVIGKNGKVAFVASLAASLVGIPVLTSLVSANASIDTERGKDILTVCNYATAASVPAIGDPIGDEAWSYPADYTFLFAPKDE